MFIIGGFVNGQRVASSEKTDKDNENSWVGGPELPEPRSRFCAVQLSDRIFAVIGGNLKELHSKN